MSIIIYIYIIYTYIRLLKPLTDEELPRTSSLSRHTAHRLPVRTFMLSCCNENWKFSLFPSPLHQTLQSNPLALKYSGIAPSSLARFLRAGSRRGVSWQGVSVPLPVRVPRAGPDLTSLAPAISPDPLPTALGTSDPEVTGHFLNPFAVRAALLCLS